MGGEGSKLCLGEEELLLIFQQRRKTKQNESISSLHKQVSLPYSESETGVLLERVTRNCCCWWCLDCELWWETTGIHSALLCPPCRTVLKYSLLEADCCLRMPSHPDCCLCFSTINPPPRKKINKQKEKPKLNIFSSFNLKYTSKIFGQIFKSNPNEKENVKKRWAGGVIRNISIK